MIMFRTVLETVNNPQWVSGIDRNLASAEGESCRKDQYKTVLTPIASLESLSDDCGVTLSYPSLSQCGERVGGK